MSLFPRSLRVASYNIYKARRFEPGGNGRGTARSVLDDVERLDVLRGADVLALQEAIVGPLAPSGPVRHTAAEIAARLGLNLADGAAPEHACFAGSPDGPGREWGVAVLSRIPARFHPLPLPRAAWSPWQRSAILAEIGPWLFATLHFEVWPLVGARSRALQMAVVLAGLERIVAGQDRPIVLAGDFNCEMGSAPHRMLAGQGFRPALGRRCVTFCAHGLRMHLDHIYVRGARVVDAGTEPLARGSDHRPVWAVLENETHEPAPAR